MTNHRRWGKGIALLAVLMFPAGLAVAYRFPYRETAGLYHTGVPAMTALFAGAAFLGILTAYPRVQNLHLLLPGGMVAVFSFLSALHFGFGPLFGNPLFGVWLPLNIQFFLPLLLLMPSFVKPRLLKPILLSLGIPLIFSALLPAWSDLPLLLIRRMSAHLPFSALVTAAILTAATLELSILRLRTEFSLGGMMTSIALLAGLSWVTALRHGATGLTILFTAGIPLHTGVATLIHWILRMEHRVLYDPLLQIYNRGYCDTILEERGGLSTDPPFTVALFDIDHFKKVNDTHGHQAGDAVLFATAQSIQREIVPGGTVCRYGGEEIIAFFPGSSGREVLADLERIRKKVEAAKVAFEGKTLSVTLSCGVAERREKGDPLMHVVQQADSALYRAKSQGRNRIELTETGANRKAEKPTSAAPASRSRPK